MKSSDLDLVLSAWPMAQPTSGFADRVMVACAAPPRPMASAVGARRMRPSRSLLAVAALVAASLLVPFLLQRSTPSDALAAIPAAADLGNVED
jgi:hypothetical protein